MSASDSVTSRLYAETRAFAGSALPARSPGLVRHGMITLEAAVDCLTSMAAVLAAFWCGALLHGGHAEASPHDRGLVSFATGFLVVLLLERDGAYRGDGSVLRIRETEGVFRAAAQSVMILLPLSLVLGRDLPWDALLFDAVILPVVLMLQKTVFHGLLRIAGRLGTGADRVVVYGAGEAGRRIVSVLLQAHRLRLRPVALVEADPSAESASRREMGYRRARFVPVQRGPICAGLMQGCRCDLLIVVPQNLTREQLAATAEAAERAGVRIALLTGHELEGSLYTESFQLDGFALALAATDSTRRLHLHAKRLLDLGGSLALLVLLAPLLALIALLVRLDSPGPALFVQTRVGRRGELFSMYKFRSMHVDAPHYERSPVTSRDPRLTRIGRLLRRTSLDELPQLLNVLLGTMSLVGPRPEMPFVVENYSDEQRRRLEATPGLTGLWQLSADRAFPIHEALEYDLYYIRNRSFFMDIAILVHTLFFAMRGGI